MLSKMSGVNKFGTSVLYMNTTLYAGFDLTACATDPAPPPDATIESEVQKEEASSAIRSDAYQRLVAASDFTSHSDPP